MEQHAIKFREFLAKKGLKYTRQRASVVDTIFATHDHFDADKLVALLRRRKDRVSKATVYRTLELLIESGLVKQLDFNRFRSYYEHTFGHAHHDHLLCTNCGKAIEFNDPRIEELQDMICKQFDFKASHHNLRISGLCRDCR